MNTEGLDKLALKLAHEFVLSRMSGNERTLFLAVSGKSREEMFQIPLAAGGGFANGFKAAAQKLEKRIEGLREALMFYRNEDNYSFCPCGKFLADGNYPCKSCGADDSAIMIDHGLVATQALKQDEGSNE